MMRLTDDEQAIAAGRDGAGAAVATCGDAPIAGARCRNCQSPRPSNAAPHSPTAPVAHHTHGAVSG